MSFKRTAFLTLSIILLAYLFMQKKKKTIQKIMMVLLLVLIILIVYLSINPALFSQIGAVWVSRFFSEDSILGARGSILLDVFRLIGQSNFAELMFGHGYDAVSNYTVYGLSAHNDFLEILFDYGLFAFILYVSFVWSLIKAFLFMNKNNDENAFAMLVSIIVFVVPSFFSHMMTYPTYFIVLALFWGRFLPRGVIQNGRKHKNRNNDIPQSL